MDNGGQVKDRGRDSLMDDRSWIEAGIVSWTMDDRSRNDRLRKSDHWGGRHNF